ncbi:MAG: 4Fe-4S dicluster domain-containing protein [Dehalococcoidia bacterium]|nr:4Fe-4S dicluster domain-containing protein [Dehalococcoidia bacterium]
MLNGLKGLGVTLRGALRSKVTAEYPKEHLPIDNRFMGFPVLTWDATRDEPYCTGCMVCARYCPTQCMSAQMQDNPKFAEGVSHRKKIIETFEINLGRCILCGICVDVCNFDAIEMSHEHERSERLRNANRVDLPTLLDMGRQYQAEVGWKQSKPNAASPNERAAAKAAVEATKAEETPENPETQAADDTDIPEKSGEDAA